MATQPSAERRTEAGKGTALAIRAMGVATSLGVDVVGACAAARAGLTRPAGLEPFLVRDADSQQMVPVVGHPVSYLTEGFVGMARIARLGAMALRDLQQRAELTPADLAETAVVLAVGSDYYLDAAEALEEAEGDLAVFGPAPPPISELAAGRRADLEAHLPARLFQLAGMGRPAEVHLVPRDQAGGAAALVLASLLLGQGRVRRCLVGGIDSLCEAETLDALQALRLLKSPDLATGLQPGEAAAFVLVEPPRSGAPAQATIAVDALASTEDGLHLLSPGAHACRALEETILKLGRWLPPPGRPAWTIGTLAGTDGAAAEWGRTLVRLPRPVAQATHWHPATAFGDAGAGAGLLALCLAVRAFERGYAPSPAALLWGSSPRGAKSAFIVNKG